MPVSGDELITVLVALVATALVVYGIRRASNKSTSKLKAGGSAQRSLASGDDKNVNTSQKPGGVATEADSEVGNKEASEQDLLSDGLAKTRSTGFVSRLGKLFSRKKIDEALLDELEEVLFTADIGPKTADRLLSAIKDGLNKNDLEDPQVVWQMLREESIEILDIDASEVSFEKPNPDDPFVLLVLGVNGAGKTTTIGKLAAKLKDEGKKVLLAAGDTFRAAAVDQLEVWAERSDATIVKGTDGQDPSSVIFDAIRQGKEGGFDVVIADTAGRLHTKTELMDELKKVGRVCEKALPGCPHETWLVLDSTTGQNAIAQAIHFKEAMDITGIVLTKLDGTAKGGVVLGISEEMKVPIRYIGIGEKIEDLRPFSPEAFVSALYQSGDLTSDEART